LRSQAFASADGQIGWGQVAGTTSDFNDEEEQAASRVVAAE